MSYTPHTWVTGETITADKLNNMESGITNNDAAISGISGLITETFATNKAYAKGDYVLYQNQLYRFTANHAAGAWTGTDVTQVVLADEVTDVNAEVANLNNAFNFNIYDGTMQYSTFVQGSRGTAGTIVANNARCTTAKVFALRVGDIISASNIDTGFKVAIAGVKNNSVVYDSGWLTAETSVTCATAGDYFVNVSKVSGANFTPSDISTLTVGFIDGASRITNISSNLDNLQEEVDDAINDLIINIEETVSIECPYEEGYYLINQNGTLTAYSSGNSWKVSQYIDISSYNEILVSGSSGWGNLICAFYDNSHNFISGYASGSSLTDVTDQRISVPSGTKYARIGTYDYGNLPIGLKTEITTAKNKAEYKWYGKKWVVIGDSLTEENSSSSKHYFDYIAEKTGISVENYGKGGTGYANPNASTGYGNFVTRMGSVPLDADVYTIFGSFNDYGYSIGNDIPIGEPTDSGTSTLCGYFNATFDALFARLPLANLGVVAPCPWVSVNQVSNITFGKNYCDALKACCERRSIPFINLYTESGMRPWDSNFVAQAYTKDPLSGVHPDETGHEILAPKFEAFLDELLMH